MFAIFQLKSDIGCDWRGGVLTAYKLMTWTSSFQ